MLDEPREPRTRPGRTNEEERLGLAHTLDTLPATPLIPSEQGKISAYVLDDP